MADTTVDLAAAPASPAATTSAPPDSPPTAAASTTATAASAAVSAAVTATDAAVAALFGCAPGAAHGAIHAALSERFLRSVDAGWELRVAASSVANGGAGVHLAGRAAAGAVLACYPGVSFEADDLKVMHGIVLSGNDYVLARRDGVLIDGRPDGASAQLRAVAQARDRRPPPPAAAEAFAVGNMVNHPPAGTRPNVVVFPFDLPAGDPLEPYVPVSPFRPPADGDPARRTAVLIAARDLEDEELWLDYKLSAGSPPPWYAPVAAS